MRPFDVRLTHWIAPGAPYFARYTAPTTQWQNASGVYFRRDYWEVTAILAGQAQNLVLGPGARTRTEVIRAGRMYLWRPQDHHALVPIDGGPLDFVQVGFTAADWQLFADLLGIRSALYSADRPPSADFDLGDAAVLAAFDDAVRALEGTPTMADLVRFLVGIVPRLLPVGSGHTGLGGPAWLVAGVEAMREEANLRGGLPRLLELVRVGRRQLARATARQYAMTPTELVADLRLRHAARLLATTSEGIASISRRVGFDDPSYFSNRFRRATSVSPREYRDRARRHLDIDAATNVPSSRGR
jgi:AraC-like DNA-binding protein